MTVASGKKCTKRGGITHNDIPNWVCPKTYRHLIQYLQNIPWVFLMVGIYLISSIKITYKVGEHCDIHPNLLLDFQIKTCYSIIHWGLNFNQSSQPHRRIQKSVLKEDSMTRKCNFLTMLVIALFMSLLLGCSSAPAQSTPLPAEVSPTAAEVIPTPTELSPTPTKAVPTTTELPPTPTEVPPTPDPASSIVWADDFEDGDFADWEVEGSVYVNEGALVVGPDSAGIITHRSEVAHGTWSYDVLISDQMLAQNRIVFCDEEIVYGLGVEIQTKQNTVISFRKIESGSPSNEEAFEAEGQITGWNHIDFTRDLEGNSTVYLNGEPILEYKDEISFTPSWFYFTGPIGSALDNVIVRDQVIEIQAQE